METPPECVTARGPLTPGLHQISRDYEQEFPEVHVGARAVKRTTHNMENVDLENEELDSDEEWEQLIEATDPSALQLSTPLTLLRDQAFRERVCARLRDSSSQVLEGMLEGASRLRPALRVIGNLLATRCHWDLLHSFCQRLELPEFLLQLAGQMLHTERIRQQPWCVTVLSDLLAVLAAYFSSDFEVEPSGAGSGIKVLEQSAIQFLQLLEQLLAQAEMGLREQSIMCLIFICETVDQSSPAVSTPFYTHLLTTHRPVLAAVLRGTHSGRTEGPAGDRQATRERWDRLLGMHTAALAATCTVSPGATVCRQAKHQIAQYISDTLFTAESTSKRTRFIKGIQQPTLCLNTLKVLYSCCQVSKATCQLLVDEALNTLLLLLQCKLSPDDTILSQTVELTLYLLTILVIQLDHVPEPLEHSVGFITSILLQSHTPAHTCAAALLIIQLSSRGSPVEIRNEDTLQTFHMALLSSVQLTVLPPLDLGAFDGLLTLLVQLLNEGEPAALADFADSELWNTAWHHLARVLRLTGDRPVMEGETPRPGQPSPIPDWNTISPSGILAFLGLATLVFTAVPYQCLPLLASPTSVVTTTLRQLLSDGFLDHLAQRLEPSAEAWVDSAHDVVLRVCQLLCFPFAMDVEEPMFSDILLALLEGEFVRHLVQVILHRLPVPSAEIALSLLCRLVLSGDAFVEQFVSSWPPSSRYLASLLQCGQTAAASACLSELLSLLAQVGRSPAGRALPFLREALASGEEAGAEAGEGRALLRALQHPDAAVRRKACGLAGRLLGEAGGEGGRRPLLDQVLARLRDPDPGVREAASLASGNAAYRAGPGPGPGPGSAQALAAALPALVGLLSDARPRTRRHAAWALHNLAHGGGAAAAAAGLGRSLLRAAAPQRLLELACRDGRAGVKEAALAALRALARWPQVREVLISMKSCEKLSVVCQHTKQRAAFSGSAGLVSPRSSAQSVLHHCNRLLEILTPTHSA
ncbi:serine/threonine-protein kinase 36-like [Carcharodon carcharias]|uniref:serine/threonine-protein kinase 36-like n=1 Tax=Carcharodon carcharias TaxID=13397 RepID=UPI001B7E7570|nr:serine/threonine-protein kinase 36-like [Carcharodon carcharias]